MSLVRGSDARRVLWVSTALDTRGGVSSYVRTLQRTPLDREWSVRHLVTHRDGPALVKIVTFARGGLDFLGTMLVRRPDVVHLHTASYGSFARKATLAALATAFRVPVVLHVHGAEFHTFHDSAPAPVRSIIRWTLTRSAAVLALGDRWAERLRKIAPNAPIVVVPNAVDPVGPATEPAPGEPLRVVFLGEIGDRKGTFTLLDAWAKVTVETAVPVRLTIAGAGQAERAQRRIAELGLAGSVDLHGWLPAAEVAALLSMAHVLCLPSRNEGQPMAVLEAMAHGLCVVASDVGGIPDLLADGSGVLVAPDDSEALAIALRRVLSDPDERTRIGARALARVCSTFDIAVVCRRIDAVYREVTRR